MDIIKEIKKKYKIIFKMKTSESIKIIDIIKVIKKLNNKIEINNYIKETIEALMKGKKIIKNLEIKKPKEVMEK